jgi:hypothetical protein
LLFDFATEGSVPQHGLFPIIEKIDPIGTLSVSVDLVTVTVKYAVLPAFPFTELIVFEIDKLLTEYLKDTLTYPLGPLNTCPCMTPIPLPDTTPVGEDDAFRLKTNDGSEWDVTDTSVAVCLCAYAVKELELTINNEVYINTTTDRDIVGTKTLRLSTIILKEEQQLINGVISFYY